MSDIYLTLDQAKDFCHKSESTLRRFVRSALNDKATKHAIKKKKLKNGGYQYLISKKILAEKYGIKGSLTPKPKRTQTSPQKNNLTSKPISGLAIKTLQDYVKTLESQLKVKDQQLNDQSHQISELLERDKENHLLLEKINHALIKFRIPEFIETQTIPIQAHDNQTEQSLEELREDQNSSVSEQVIEKAENPVKSKVKKKKKKKRKSKANFTEWLEQF